MTAGRRRHDNRTTTTWQQDDDDMTTVRRSHDKGVTIHDNANDTVADTF